MAGGANTRAASARSQARREPRLRLACARCQRRKIRCDGALPACNNCRKASAVCSDGESLRARDLPRAYIGQLRRRISWLEGILRERCPDVDLAQDPVAAVDSEDAADISLLDDLAASSPPRIAETTTPPPPPPPVEHSFSQPTAAPSGTGPGLYPPSSTVAAPANPTNGALSHEIGLVSLAASQDPKYIGPSSGHLLARLMLSSTARTTGHILRRAQPARAPSDLPFLRDLVEASHRPVFATKEQAAHLCTSYFDVIHVQYPILHQPTFMRHLDHVFDSNAPDPAVAFQVYMVLAISATIMTRRLRVPLSPDGYCASAMQYFDRLYIENSIQGLQCLVLLLIYTMHSPSMKLNAWYLNYQCIAAVIDLGLQRKVSTSNGISMLEQEMRTRIFWVVFTLDRTIATMMGRPIGLRDEACELRLPQNIDDASLASSTLPSPSSELPSHMSFSIHLFKLAKINSEIKYVANSIVRESPPYAYPNIINIHDWQRDVLQQLDQWASEIPPSGGDGTYIDLLCNLRFHSIRMLLLRPSPAIPTPSVDSLKKCHESAIQCIRLFDRLYKRDLLVHSWITFHSLILSTITMFYCIWAVPEIARSTELDVLTGDLRVSLSILSATGEHWSGAKRSRDILDELAGMTIRWIMGSSTSTAGSGIPSGDRREVTARQPRTTDSGAYNAPGDSVGDFDASMLPTSAGGLNNPNTFASAFQTTQDRRQNSLLDPFDPALDCGSIFDQYGPTDSVNMDNIMLDLFQDFIPPLPNFC